MTSIRRTKALNRETEDAQADYQQDTDKVLGELLQRVRVVIDKYSRDNGYSLILDVSSQQTPVVWAANTADITADIIALYDKNAPVARGCRSAGSRQTAGCHEASCCAGEEALSRRNLRSRPR